MLAIELYFPVGRYHATPWGRHVNEGDVAWPPEPWRILRALVAVWHHKLASKGGYKLATLNNLIESLASELPDYRLPPASHAHTRHYMPEYYQGDRPLVLDAFAAVERDAPLAVIWSTLNLEHEQCDMLDALLAGLNYLGRAESWVVAKRLQQAPEPNCRPGEAAVDEQTGEVCGETVTLLAPLSAVEYANLRKQFQKNRNTAKKLALTLPETLLEALSVDTMALRKAGWNRPPAAREVRYLRPLDALKPQRRTMRRQPLPATTIRFMLTSKPLPPVEETLRLGELMRTAAMSQAKNLFGEGGIPPVFSGHGLPQNHRHSHAFYLAFDSNGDGYLDRMLVHAPGGFGPAEQRVLARIRRLRARNGSEWQLSLESLGGVEVAPELCSPATQWISVTPYLHPWYVKKRLRIEDQIRRECRDRGLPEPMTYERLTYVEAGRRGSRRALRFKCHRDRRHGQNPLPDTVGSFWRLRFAEPLTCPLALGTFCHFGLGLFRPETDATTNL